MSNMACMRQCSDQTMSADGVHIKCKLGYWEVTSDTVRNATLIALWKFRDYYKIGKYNDFLDKS